LEDLPHRLLHHHNNNNNHHHQLQLQLHSTIQDPAPALNKKQHHAKELAKEMTIKRGMP
jgi:hypothetical protein